MEHSDSSPPSIRINPTVAGVPEEHLLDEIRQIRTRQAVEYQSLEDDYRQRHQLLQEAHEHQIHDCIRRHFNASNTQLNPSQRQSMTGSPPPGIPPLLQLHESSPTLSREQLDQQHLLLMQLQDQPLNLAQPPQSLAKQPSPTQLSSLQNSSQNSAASSLSNLLNSNAAGSSAFGTLQAMKTQQSVSGGQSGRLDASLNPSLAASATGSISPSESDLSGCSYSVRHKLHEHLMQRHRRDCTNCSPYPSESGRTPHRSGGGASNASDCLTCEHLHLTSREDLRVPGAPAGPINSVGPGAGMAGGKLRPVSRTYSAPLPLITGTNNPTFLQVNTSAAGKPNSGSHSPMEGTSRVMPYLGSASGGLFHSSTASQLQPMGHPGSDPNGPPAPQDFHTIRQQIRANVLQKSKEKQEKKMMYKRKSSTQK